MGLLDFVIMGIKVLLIYSDFFYLFITFFVLLFFEIFQKKGEGVLGWRIGKIVENMRVNSGESK